MSSLMIEDRGQMRAATPAEILRAAESLCDPAALYSFPAQTRCEVSAFARWCLAPAQDFCFLIVTADGCGSVLKYEALQTHDIKAVVKMAMDAAGLMPAWIVAAHPRVLPVRDAFAEQVKAELAKSSCENVHYLRVQADVIPSAHYRPAFHQQTPFWILRNDRPYPASGEIVYLVGRILAARRLERGQVLQHSWQKELAIQLCAGALKEASVDLVLLDDQSRLQQYLQAYRGSLEFVLQYTDSIAQQINRYQPHTTILVSCQRSQMIPFTAVDRFLIASLGMLLARKAKPPEAYVVVGTDRVWSYRHSRDERVSST